MEYIKKEELIIGEIYKADNGSLTYIMKATKDLENVKNIPEYCEFMRHGCFNGSHLTFTNATPEEKHWLNCCITADKFITFEEAMKTFIPEYYQYIGEIDSYKSSFIKGKTYKIINKNDLEASFNFIDEKDTPNGYEGVNWKKFKPSTKEAYDAQFVVKEPEFVLPEKWCIFRNNEHFEEIGRWFNKINNDDDDYYTNSIIKSSYPYLNNSGIQANCLSTTLINGYIEITFEQFKKYVLKEESVEEKVIKPLPQFKIIETIETITKVENNEGNQFFIGDVVKTEAGLHFKIIGFKYDENKTKILAIATDNYPKVVKDINDIEHYIEPKVEVEETLLEKAKRLYPVGTKVNSLGGSPNQTIDSNTPFMSGEDGVRFTMNCLVYLNGKWAEIIK